MSHKVFIDRCRDTEPATAQGLAQALAAKYQIDPQQILGRLAKGRFRVKANLSLEQAQRFVTFLEGHGALCSVEDASGQVVLKSDAPASAGMELELEPEVGEESNEFALHTPLPPAMPSEVPEYESGLAAAFSGGGTPQDLGALSGDSAGFTLSALDDADEPLPDASAAPPPAASPTAESFLPPEMANETALELDTDSGPAAPPTAASFAPPEPDEPLSMDMEVQAFTPAPQEPVVLDDEVRSTDSMPSEAEPELAGKQPPMQMLANNSRLRFAVGVALAIILGFAAAHLTASAREDDKYSELRKDLEVEYAAATSIDAWEALDEAKEATIASFKSRQKNIVITSLGIWAAIGGLFFLAWSRLIKWDKLAHAP